MIAAVAAPAATVLAIGGVIPAFALAVVAWLAYTVCWLRADSLWPEVGVARARAALVGGTVLSLVAFIVGLFGNYWFSIDRELCGEGTAGWVALVVAIVVYIGAGVVVLRTASRLLWAWPLLVLAGWVVSVAVRAVLPGGHGFCET
jgi:hypothetical protein